LKNGLYNTTFKSDYAYRDTKNARGALDQQLQKDLRTHHFNLGNQVGEYDTTYRRGYTAPLNPERAVFNAQKA